VTGDDATLAVSCQPECADGSAAQGTAAPYSSHDRCMPSRSRRACWHRPGEHPVGSAVLHADDVLPLGVLAGTRDNAHPLW